MATSEDRDEQVLSEEPLAAANLFRRCLEELTLSIDDPAPLAQKLFAKMFISPEVFRAATTQAKLPRERTRDLLTNIYDKIVLDSENLGNFLTLLHQVPASGDLSRIRDRLKADYGGNSVHCTVHENLLYVNLDRNTVRKLILGS